MTEKTLEQLAQEFQKHVDVVNQTNITSRLGRVYPSMAKALYQVIQTGGFEPFLTEAALLASVPTVPKKAAKALDTKKIWYWNGSSWADTGLSELDQAKNYVNSNALVVKPNLGTENLNDVLTRGVYRQPSDANATTANNYPIGTNGAGTLVVIEGSGFVIQEYTTWFGRKFWRTKQGTNPIQLWQEVSTVANLDNKALIVKPNLVTEHLNSILDRGIYRQPSNQNGSIANGYPEDSASGILKVYQTDTNFTVQVYITWVGNKYWRTKYTTNNFTVWKKIATQAQIEETLSRKPNLSTEDLNAVLTLGIYQQPSDANATLANNYPDTRAGKLEVKDGGGFIIQEYTTWFGRKFYRTKQGSNPIQPWKEIATVESINSPYKGKKIAVFGDSLIEPSGAYPVRVAAALGATLLKFGFASHTMSKYPDSPLGRDKNAMYRFAKAINTGDWTDVIAGGEWVRDNLNDDNMPQINAMVATDWTAVDYIVIAFGTNDIYSITPLGEDFVADETGATFKGAICYIVEQIQAKYPHIQIMFVSPTFRTRWFQTPNPDRPEQNSDTLPDPDGKPYIAYIDALLELRNKYHLPIFDFYRTSGINIQTVLTYLTDGVHPNAKGTELCAKKFQGFLLNN
jgi:hypothetical protein